MSSEDATAQALQAKEAGNAAYKSRDFATAIAKYQEAWDLHKDITFLNNLAGEKALCNPCVQLYALADCTFSLRVPHQQPHISKLVIMMQR